MIPAKSMPPLLVVLIPHRHVRRIERAVLGPKVTTNIVPVGWSTASVLMVSVLPIFRGGNHPVIQGGDLERAADGGDCASGDAQAKQAGDLGGGAGHSVAPVLDRVAIRINLFNPSRSAGGVGGVKRVPRPPVP